MLTSRIRLSKLNCELFADGNTQRCSGINLENSIDLNLSSAFHNLRTISYKAKFKHVGISMLWFIKWAQGHGP